MNLDSDSIWQAVEAGDPRFDGWVFCGVRTTGIYCRPSCPARTPRRKNVRFFATAAAAQGAGFRACKRCRPDAAPGSPEWDRRADLAGRAMRLIADGVVDREGVAGLAGRLGYSERHLHRQLVAVAGAGPLALARAQRAQTARVLVETTSMPITEIAFAAGFRSVRQFNSTVAEVFAMNPTELRSRARRAGEPKPGKGHVTLRLPYRRPLDAAGLIDFFGLRAVSGVEQVRHGTYHRSLRLPHGGGIVELSPGDGHLEARFALSDVRDLGAAIQRSRTMLDLDSDPLAVTGALAGDPLLGTLVRSAPGRRVPGHVDGRELAIRAILGQQVSLRSASTLAQWLTESYGDPLEEPAGAVTHLFPAAATLAEVDPSRLPMPRTRGRALTSLAQALASGELDLDGGAERADVRQRLLGVPGVGPWTAEYVSMRALRDPDAFLPGDVGVRHALERLSHPSDPTSAERLAEAWRPYRAYAVQYLWGSLLASGAARSSARSR